ncbi:MAG: transcription termination/antitermination protein NusA [Halobacteriovoraceae bacterium]|nr:transcription termination/antitermination protein NusA [Halobacteriovoraceae bacterium]
MFSELGRVIEALGKERGVEKEIVINAIEQAFLVTARKKYGIQGEYETKYNADDDEVEIYQYKNVVENVRDSILEMTLDEAKQLDEDAEIGDQLGLRIENPDFTRVDVQTAKQIIFQKVRDAEREILFGEFKHREGDLITGIARRYERGKIMVDLGKAEAILPRREIIPGETFKPGDRIQAYLTEVVMTNRGPEIRLSRTSPMFLVKLFEVEVPEIQDGTIIVKSAAREPGYRAKIAVLSADGEIDPVGACVGLKGSRVQNIVNELQGEKIDIVRWNDDLGVFSRSALAPAEITNIMIDDESKAMDVVVEDDQLALAIGRRGQNVRLAAMLTGHNINIISRTKLQEKVKASSENLRQVELITDAYAQVLVQNGIMNIGDLISTDATEVSQALHVSADVAEDIIKTAMKGVEDGSLEVAAKEDDELISASAVPAYSGLLSGDDKEATSEESDGEKFSEAERRLREELAAFKLK